MSSAVPKDFFKYTSGRWLWDEEQQLRNRYKPFNVSKLQRVAATSVGAHACHSMIKLGEGGFNKVFRLVMDNGSVVIARIPNPNAGPSNKTVASKVATMDFARTILEVPVPKVLAWDGDKQNSVGSEYILKRRMGTCPFLLSTILMEEAIGSHLSEVWDGLEIDAKAEVLEALVGVEKKLLSLSFTRYGNIFFANDTFEGCENVHVNGEVPESRRLEAGKRFVIGPVVDRDFWNKERGRMDIDRCPWLSAPEYLKAIARREKTWLSRYAVPKQGRELFYIPTSQNSVDAHISLYDRFLAVADFIIPNQQNLLKPSLWHWDLHASNLFVDSNNKLTAIIDWQDTGVGPLLLQARYPSLVRYNEEVILQLPDNYESLEDQEEKNQLATQVEKSILLHVYKSSISEQNRTLKRSFKPRTDLSGARLCSTRLTHGMATSCHLENVSYVWNGRFWNEIAGPNAPVCPFHFTSEELKTHYNETEGWNEKADFWDSLSGFVSKDGWVAHENYEQALEMFSQMRDEGLKSLQGKEKEEFEISTRWAVRPGALKS